MHYNGLIQQRTYGNHVTRRREGCSGEKVKLVFTNAKMAERSKALVQDKFFFATWVRILPWPIFFRFLLWHSSGH